MEMQRRYGWTPLFMLALAAGLMSLLAACSSDADMAPSSLSFTATGGTGSSGFSTRLATTGEGVVIGNFRLGVHEIELEQTMEQEIDSEVEFEGSFIVDLLTDTITDTIGGGSTASLLATLPAGTYEELEFELTPIAQVESGNATPIALYASGSYASPGNGGSTVNFTITVTRAMQIEVEGPQAVVLDSATNDLIVAFRLDQLLSVANLETLISGPLASGSVPSIDIAVTPSTLLADFTDFENLVKNALEFGEDHDGNHDLDETEDVDDDSMM